MIMIMIIIIVIMIMNLMITRGCREARERLKSRPRENMVGVNMVLAEYHFLKKENTLEEQIASRFIKPRLNLMVFCYGQFS